MGKGKSRGRVFRGARFRVWVSEVVFIRWWERKGLIRFMWLKFDA